MAYDAFLKIEGIDGESQDKTHPHEIEVDSFSWGEDNTGAGKVSKQDFHFTMPLSLASPNLMLACATGRHSPSATLTCRKAGFEFLKIKLFDVLVSSYHPGGKTAENFPEDSISLNFAKIDFLYSVQRTGETVEATFDFTVIS